MIPVPVPDQAVVANVRADDYYLGTGPRTILMKNKGKDVIFFTGPKTISRGAKLTVRNDSNPKVVGRHTFSLVKKDRLPKTRKQRLKCPICGTIALAHEFRAKTNKIDEPTVDVGRKGWDTSFGKTGDSWFVSKRGKSQTRKVTAPVGTTLRYFCGVHPSMQGKIKVVN